VHKCKSAKAQKEMPVGGCIVKFASSLAEAVQTANELVVKGDVVLLSTACASYDMFENYEQRGNQFIELVRKTGGVLSDAHRKKQEGLKKTNRTIPLS